MKKNRTAKQLLLVIIIVGCINLLLSFPELNNHLLFPKISFSFSLFSLTPSIFLSRLKKNLSAHPPLQLQKKKDLVPKQLQKLLLNSLERKGDEQRLYNFLYKVSVERKPFTFQVFGGSVTKGLTVNQTWGDHVFNFLHSLFPHKDNRFMNLALPACGPLAPALCYEAIVPEPADLVATEFAINSGPLEAHYDLNAQILRSPRSPPLHQLITLPLKFTGNGTNFTLIAAHPEFNLSVISLEKAVKSEFPGDSFKSLDLWLDNVHLNDAGHELFALLYINFLKEHILAFAHSYLLDPQPPQMPPSHFSLNKTCFCLTFDPDLSNSQKPEVSKNSGWELTQPPKPHYRPRKHKGSPHLALKFYVERTCTVSIMYYGGGVMNLGRVNVTLDGEQVGQINSKIIKGYMIFRSWVSPKKVSRGNHSLVFRIVPNPLEPQFRLIGLGFECSLADADSEKKAKVT